MSLNYQKIENNLKVIGTVNGRDVALDGSTLDQHVGATADVHGAVGFVVGTNNAYELFNKTLTSSTNFVVANGLRSVGENYVQVSGTPSDGQYLIANGPGSAIWKTVVAGGISFTNIGDGAQIYTGLTATDVEFRSLTSTLNHLFLETTTSTIDFALNPPAISINAFNGAPIGTVVGTSDGQTLSNKSLVDTTTYIVDSVDPTISIRFNSAGTAGTSTTISSQQTADRILTLPDATDQLVARTTSDTLTNKTLTDTSNLVWANSLKTTTGAVTVSTATAPSAGQVLYADSATSASWKTLTNAQNSSNAAVQTISAATPVELTGITLTAQTAGTFFISFNASINLNKTTRIAYFTIYAPTAQTGSQRQFIPGSASAVSVISTQWVTTLVANDAVTVYAQIDSISGGPTLSIYERGLSLLRLF